MKKKGFTLIELIVSIVLVGVILASMIGTLISLKNTYGVINDDVEARTYSALVSKVINEHIMKNNGIRSYNCNVDTCTMILGTKKEMTLKILSSLINTSDMMDTSSNTPKKIGVVKEKETTIAYYETGGSGYSYYKTLKYYEKVYDKENGDKVEVPLGYKFEKIESKSYSYDSLVDSSDISDYNGQLQDYLVNITIHMNNPKYNIELYATSVVDGTDNSKRICNLTYNSNGGTSCEPNVKSVIEGKPWNLDCIPTRDGHGFTGWYTQASKNSGTKIESDTLATPPLCEDVVVYAHWDNSTYSCEAGTYLPRQSTVCADCVADYYCPGLENAYYSETYDQGIYACKLNYYSEPRSENESDCKITCGENTHIEHINDTECTNCTTNYISGRHEVNQGSTSTCSPIDVSTPQITGGTEIIYGSNDVTLTCNISSDGTLDYSFGYTTSSSGSISNWSDNDSNQLVVSKTAYIGNRWYACRAKLSGDSTYKTSNKTQLKIRNAKLTFRENGGTIDGNSILYTKKGVASLYSGEVNSTSASAPTASKAGHTFTGWWTSTSDGSKVLNINGSLTGSVVNGYTTSSSFDMTEDKTLYAQYSKIEYTIKYNCGSGSGSAPSEQKVYYGDTVTINGTGASCSKTGYNFKSWNDPTGNNGWTGWTGVWTYTNNQYGITNNTLTLTANYEEKPIRIYYAIGGGTVSSSTYTTNGNWIATKTNSSTNFYQVVRANEKTDLYNATAFGLSKGGYSMREWCTVENGEGTCFGQDDQITYATFSSNATNRDTYKELKLYPKWIGNKYVVTLNHNLFDSVKGTFNGVTIGYNPTLQIIELNGTLSTKSLSFAKIYNVSFNTNDKYSLTIKYMDGNYTATSETKKLSLEIQKDDQNYTDRIIGTHFTNLTLPTSNSATTELTIKPEITNTGANNIWYWFWQNNAGGITFNSYKIQVFASKVDSKEVTSGGTYGTLTTPAKAGYTFGGWWTTLSNDGDKITSTSTVNKNYNHTLYAHWDPNVYTINLNKNNGSGGTDTVYLKYNTGWYSNSGATTSISSITKPTRSGYSFNGYYTSTSGGTQIIDSSGTILSDKLTSFTSNTTLYAHWSAAPLPSSELDNCTCSCTKDCNDTLICVDGRLCRQEGKTLRCCW